MMSVGQKLKSFWNKCCRIFSKTTTSTSISIVHNIPNEKSAYELFQLIFDKWLRLLSSSLGYNIMDSKFIISVHTIITITLIFSMFAFCIFTTVTYESEMAWKGSACLSLSLQVVITKKRTFCIDSKLFGTIFCLLRES